MGREERSQSQPAARAWPISAYLVALALATSLPITAAGAFLAFHFVSESSQRVRSEYEDRLRLLRNATELRVSNIIEDLQVLALSPALQQGKFAEFRDHANQAANLIGAISIVVYARDGQQLLNTRVGADEPLPRRGEFDLERRLFETGMPQVSGLLRTVIDQQPFVSIAVPVSVSGEVRYALTAGLSPTYLASLMVQYVPDGLVGSIIDERGLLLARRPLIEGLELVGQPTIPEVMQRMGKSSAFWIKATSRTGVLTYTSILKSDRTGWTINVAMPRELIDGPLHHTIEWIDALVIVTFALGLLFARLLGVRFLRALSGLENYVTELGRSQVAVPVPGPFSEVNRMKNVLYEVGRDIATSEQLIERERSLLQATVESLPIGVLLAAPSGRVTLINRRMLSIWGIENLETINDPGRLSGVRESGQAYGPHEWPIVRALREGIVTEAEEVIRVVHGAKRNVIMTAVPVYDDDGEMIAAVCACYDVTDLRTALRQQKALLDEINHRVKNTLGTVQSIARLSRASSQSFQEYASAFEGRLLALSEAYNLLTENNWEGASLQAVIERTLAPFAGPDRVEISGPSVVLPPKIALDLAAVIQELSTNAAKYGALSAPSGKVTVNWSSPDGDVICVSWVESDGPVVSQPTRQGFGTKMIQGIFRNDPSWAVTFDYEPEGLCCTMRFSVGSVRLQGQSSSLRAAS